MSTAPMLLGSGIYLDCLDPSSIDKRYADWLNDESVNQYLESRYISHSVKSVKEFVQSVNESADQILWGIFDHERGLHIGNIKLGPIDLRYRRGTIGLLIGDKFFWGKGIAAKAISLVVDYAFRDLKLHKIDAGCYASNMGSMKSFLKVGFEVEATLKDHFRLDGNWEDSLILSIINREEKLAE